MATKTTPEGNEQHDLDLGAVYTRTELFIEKNKKAIAYGTVGVLMVVGGLIGYKKFVSEPKQKAAQENIWKAQYYFENDSLDKAINGDGGNYYGFDYVASEYGGTPTGKLAHYYLGACYMQKGEYEKAIENYKAADLDDDILRTMAVGGIGDAYVELNKPDEAIPQFEKASTMVTNEFTTPMYLMKLGILLKQKGDWKGAAKAFGRVANEFPTSQDANAAKKYLGMAEAKEASGN